MIASRSIKRSRVAITGKIAYNSVNGAQANRRSIAACDSISFYTGISMIPNLSPPCSALRASTHGIPSSLVNVSYSYYWIKEWQRLSCTDPHFGRVRHATFSPSSIINIRGTRRTSYIVDTSGYYVYKAVQNSSRFVLPQWLKIVKVGSKLLETERNCFPLILSGVIARESFPHSIWPFNLILNLCIGPISRVRDLVQIKALKRSYSHIGMSKRSLHSLPPKLCAKMSIYSRTQQQFNST